MFAILLMVEKWIFSIKTFRIPNAIKHIYVIFFVMISFIIFNATDLNMAVNDIGGLFGAGVENMISAETSYYIKSYGMIFALGIFGSLPVAKNVIERLTNSKRFGGIIEYVKPVVVAILLLICTAYLVDGSFNPFLYFRF